MSLERIPARFRLALAAKGLLLAAFTGVFVALGLRALLGDDHGWVVRIVVGLLMMFPLPMLGPATLVAFADAVLGQAERISGARALASRRAGWSLALPDGHFAEYILTNPWGALVPERRYTVLIGKRSRVLIAAPVEEPQ